VFIRKTTNVNKTQAYVLNKSYSPLWVATGHILSMENCLEENPI